MKFIGGIVLVLLVIGVIAGGGHDKGNGGAAGSSSAGPRVGDEVGAQVYCEEFVKQALKSPSTADFSDEQAEHHGGKLWEVNGAVDSQNSFGAMIRNDFTCSVRYTGADNYRLLSLSGLDN